MCISDLLCKPFPKSILISHYHYALQSSVVHCHSGYSNEPSKVMFAFPKQDELRQKWVKFLNREAFAGTQSSQNCIEHFEEKYIIPHPLKTRLDMKLNHKPTIHTSSIPKSQQACISPPIRKNLLYGFFKKMNYPFFNLDQNAKV